MATLVVYVDQARAGGDGASWDDAYRELRTDLVGASRIFNSGIVDLGGYELQSRRWLITQQPADVNAHPDGLCQVGVDSNGSASNSCLLTTLLRLKGHSVCSGTFSSPPVSQ
ncbi:MAG: hypothetical protein ACSHYA_18050 [Opitutaceae bacterium]